MAFSSVVLDLNFILQTHCRNRIPKRWTLAIFYGQTVSGFGMQKLISVVYYKYKL